MPIIVLLKRSKRILLSIYFHAEKIAIKPTEKPVKPIKEIAVLIGNGSRANNGIETTESPKPNVDRVREPKKTTKTTRNIIVLSIISSFLTGKRPVHLTSFFPRLLK